jgi:hypothetical protein
MRPNDVYELLCPCGETVQAQQPSGEVRCSCGRVQRYEWREEEKQK